MKDMLYVKPSSIFIPRCDESEKLYEAEAERQKIIERCARLWMDLHQISDSEFWTRGIPQQLFDILDSWDKGAAYIAAKAFVENHDNTHLECGCVQIRGKWRPCRKASCKLDEKLEANA